MNIGNEWIKLLGFNLFWFYDLKKKELKRTLRKPIRFAEEYSIPSSKRCKKPTTDNNLYEIEVNRDRNLVRIHCKGYSEKFDEWRPILLRL